MSGVIPPLPQSAFMARCSVNVQRLFTFYRLTLKLDGGGQLRSAAAVPAGKERPVLSGAPQSRCGRCGEEESSCTSGKYPYLWCKVPLLAYNHQLHFGLPCSGILRDYVRIPMFKCPSWRLTNVLCCFGFTDVWEFCNVMKIACCIAHSFWPCHTSSRRGGSYSAPG
jgi:hypothetical protein